MSPFVTSLEIAARPEAVFAAIVDPERLARWWGPAGFTNTFHICEPTAGGRWSLTMHAPNGNRFPNELVFGELEPGRLFVVEHVSEPKYRLTVALAPSAAGTTVTWSQAFESAEVARKLEHIVVPANRQNLERLADEVQRAVG